MAPEWRAPYLAELDKMAAQTKKDEAKLWVMKLAKKMHNEKAAAEVRAVREAEMETAE